MSQWNGVLLGVLDGVRVIDFSRVLSGPYCTMVLADLGADVLKIENFPGGDDARRFGPHVNGESYSFASLNRNKRSVALDLKSEDGRSLVLALLDDCDVVVENFRPGVMDRLGLNYEVVRSRNSDVIYCSISGFGQTGPYRERPGYDIIAQGVTGLMRITGQPDGRPTKVGIAINDMAAGATAVQAVLAAYIHRLRRSEGQFIDISLVDSGLAWTIWESAAYLGSGVVAGPTGTRHRLTAPYQAFRTSDGYVTVGANTERFWRILCTDVLERPELIDDPRFSDNARRVEHVNELEAEVESVLTTRGTDHWVATLDRVGVPGGPVLTYDQALENAHVLARGMIAEIEHPRIGRMNILASAIGLSGTPAALRTPAPWLGQHTSSTLRRLGYTDEQIDRLYARGIIHDEARQERAAR